MNTRSPSVRVFSTALLAIVIYLPWAPAAAPARAAGPPLTPPPGLRLTATPILVDVGDFETFTLSATSWPTAVGVTLSFLAGHHGFAGPMTWDGRCGCFRVAVDLARRIHPTEQARATATLRKGSAVAFATTTFWIRGLAANGRDYAPGGTPGLTSWVSEPDPVVSAQEHFCAWIKTEDGLGVSGFRVSFVAHYSYGTRGWYAGVTGPTGLLCSDRSIGKTKAGVRVTVDIYANNLRQTLSFVPRRA